MKTTEDAFNGSSVLSCHWSCRSGHPQQADGRHARSPDQRSALAYRVRHRLTDERTRHDGVDRDPDRPGHGSHQPQLFTMLMLMAIVTTVMTGPLLTLCDESKGASPAVDANF